MRTKWSHMASSAANALAGISDSTGRGSVFVLSTGVLPITGMQKVVQYLVTPATCTAFLHAGVLITGEFVVTRRDGPLVKAYSHVYGVSRTGGTVYGGHFKNFDFHHVPSTRVITPADLFGHNPLSPYRRIRRSGLTSA